MSIKILAYIGGILVLIGLITILTALLGWSLDFLPLENRFQGPCATLVFGWLLIVPSLYDGIPRKGYLALVVVYVLVFIGMNLLLVNMNEVSWNIIILYAGVGALAFAARRLNSIAKDREMTRACAADTLFGVTILMIMVLCYNSLIRNQSTIGLIGVAISQAFSILSGLTSSSKILQDIVKFITDNLELEYYVYAIASLFWLANDPTPTERKVPPKIVAYFIAIFGLTTLFLGIYFTFLKLDDSIIGLFRQLCICGIGVAIAYLGVRKISTTP